MRATLEGLLFEVRLERERARKHGNACAILVFLVLEEALVLALESEVL
jgi:hypothetical protein